VDMAAALAKVMLGAEWMAGATRAVGEAWVARAVQAVMAERAVAHAVVVARAATGEGGAGDSMAGAEVPTATAAVVRRVAARAGKQGVAAACWAERAVPVVVGVPTARAVVGHEVEKWAGTTAVEAAKRVAKVDRAAWVVEAERWVAASQAAARAAGWAVAVVPRVARVVPTAALATARSRQYSGRPLPCRGSQSRSREASSCTTAA